MIEPTADRVILRRLPTPRKHGSILAPDSAVKLSQEGVVVARGPGERNKQGKLCPLDVEVDQRVLFGVHAAKPIDIDGAEFWVLRESDIVAIIE
jgi:chaperonin GroES